jgi:hypothetical protein
MARMTDQDLGAIYDYLRSVPKVAGVVNSFPDSSPPETLAHN